MTFYSIELSLQRPEITISRENKEPLSFSAKIFRKESFRGAQGYDLFGELNRYVSSWPEYRQDQLYAIYHMAVQTFEEVFEKKALEGLLSNYIQDIIQLIDPVRLTDYIQRDPGIVVPDSVPEEFDGSQDGYSREKTYTRQDYYELVSFCILLRALMPILGEYMDLIKEEMDIGFKEFAAVQLMEPSGILNSPPVEKLGQYISVISASSIKGPGSKPSHDRVMEGFSSEDGSFLDIALVIVNRLCITDLRGGLENRQLIAVLYNYIYSSRATKETFKEKNMGSSQASGAADSRSRYEAFKKRLELTPGEESAIEHTWANYHRPAIYLAPELSFEEIEACVARTSTMEDEEIGQPQLVLMSWLFKTVHDPLTVSYVRPSILKQNLGVAEAVLWNWGFKYLACFISAKQIVSDDAVYVSTVDTKSQIPKDLIQRVEELFPYVWRSVHKSRMMESETHPVISDIDQVIGDFISGAWLMTTTTERIKEVFGDTRRRLSMISSIRADLVRLVIAIEERRKPVNPLLLEIRNV